MSVRRVPPHVRVSGGFLLFLSILLFLDSGYLLAHFLTACLFHELGHFAALRIIGGRVRAVYLRATGAEMELWNPNELSYPEEIAAVLAGPAAGIALSALAARMAYSSGWEELYILSGVSLALSVFNLLPVRVLDGGQSIYLLLCWLMGPVRAESVSYLLSLLAASLLTAAGMLIFAAGGGGALFFASVFLLYQSLRPTRQGKIL